MSENKMEHAAEHMEMQAAETAKAEAAAAETAEVQTDPAKRIREKPEKITKMDLMKCWWKFLTTMFCTISNVNRCATAYVYSLSAILRKLYKNEEDFKEAMVRHTEFFMTRYDIGGLLSGLVISMEEQRANDLYEKGESEITGESIASVKASLMGPFAGIGDTFENIVFFTPALVIGTPLAIAGNFWAVPLAFLLGVMPDWIIGTITYPLGYAKGKDFVARVITSNVFDYILKFAGIVGMMLFGVLTHQLVNFSTPGWIVNGTSVTDLVNSVVPGIMKLVPVFACLWLFKKKNVPVALIIIVLIVLCLILGALGAFTVAVA